MRSSIPSVRASPAEPLVWLAWARMEARFARMWERTEMRWVISERAE